MLSKVKRVEEGAARYRLSVFGPQAVCARLFVLKAGVPA